MRQDAKSEPNVVHGVTGRSEGAIARFRTASFASLCAWAVALALFANQSQAVQAASTVAAASTASRSRSLMIDTWYWNLRRQFELLHGELGGLPVAWPESTLANAPMCMAQSVYQQIGGDSAALDLTQDPVELQQEELWNLFLAMGGDPVTQDLVPLSLDAQVWLFGEYCRDMGGTFN